MGFLQRARILLNNAIAPAGFELVRLQNATMERAIERLPDQGFRFGSVIDIGAAEGKWSELAAPLLSDARFLMVEALREREPLLRSYSEKSAGRISYQICAAGPTHGATSFMVSDDLNGSGAISSSPAGERVREVEMMTVDELVSNHGLKGRHLLKLDTHGFELPILEGAKATLAETDVVIMECYLFNGADRRLLFWEMCEWMAKRGFRCFDVVDPLVRPKDKMLWQLDLFFARSEWAKFEDRSYL